MEGIGGIGGGTAGASATQVRTPARASGLPSSEGASPVAVAERGAEAPASQGERAGVENDTTSGPKPAEAILADVKTNGLDGTMRALAEGKFAGDTASETSDGQKNPLDAINRLAAQADQDLKNLSQPKGEAGIDPSLVRDEEQGISYASGMEPRTEGEKPVDAQNNTTEVSVPAATGKPTEAQEQQDSPQQSQAERSRQYQENIARSVQDLKDLWSAVPQNIQEADPLLGEVSDMQGNIDRYTQSKLEWYKTHLSQDQQDWGEFQVMQKLGQIRQQAINSIGRENADRILAAAQEARLASANESQTESSPQSTAEATDAKQAEAGSEKIQDSKEATQARQQELADKIKNGTANPEEMKEYRDTKKQETEQTRQELTQKALEGDITDEEIDELYRLNQGKEDAQSGAEQTAELDAKGQEALKLLTQYPELLTALGDLIQVIQKDDGDLVASLQRLQEQLMQQENEESQGNENSEKENDEGKKNMAAILAFLMLLLTLGKRAGKRVTREVAPNLVNEKKS